MQIRRLAADDAEVLWKLRLAALESEPEAFAESAGEHRLTAVETYAARLREGGEESLVLGAFDGAELAGMAGLYREPRVKLRHKARIWGVFVVPTHRGCGIGRALVSAAVESARAMPGVEQVLLTVSVTQQAARRLYAGLGFRSFGVEPRAMRMNGAYLDEEYMVLPLSAPLRPDAPPA